MLLLSSFVVADLKVELDSELDPLMKKVISWRHNLHQYPELSNREYKTSKKVTTHLQSLGIEVETGIAYTGVVGLIKGGLPGPTIALRADMDALPVEEKTGLPFASKERAKYLGQNVGVMHACGYDAHVAILMGVAEFLSKNKDRYLLLLKLHHLDDMHLIIVLLNYLQSKYFFLRVESRKIYFLLLL